MLDLSFLCKSFCSQKYDNLTGWLMFVERLSCSFIPLPQQTPYSHSQKFSYHYFQEGRMVPHSFCHLKERLCSASHHSLECVFLASPEAAAFATRLSIAELPWALPPFSQPSGHRHCTTSACFLSICCDPVPHQGGEGGCPCLILNLFPSRDSVPGSFLSTR